MTLAMKINLSPRVTEQVLQLASTYNYDPEEIISIGIAVAGAVLSEKADNNMVAVVTREGEKVADLKIPEPQAIDKMVKRYVDSLSHGTPVMSASDLVKRLENERDRSKDPSV